MQTKKMHPTNNQFPTLEELAARPNNPGVRRRTGKNKSGERREDSKRNKKMKGTNQKG
jgi:hypothetical protein